MTPPSMDRIHAYVPGWDFPKLNPSEHLTNHFGLVSDFLSECWSKLRCQQPGVALQGRVHFGGALERPRHRSREQDGERLGEAALPRTRTCRSPMKIWSGSFASRSNPAGA